MGANAVNTAAERLAPRDRGADRRPRPPAHPVQPGRPPPGAGAAAFRSGRWPSGTISGERVRDGIIEAWAFAAADPYRAATHNKGIMNGVDAVVIATGNDWRAIEAGAHAYAARSGRYTSLSRWSAGQTASWWATLEMPMAVGTVGGATRVHPAARVALKLLGVELGARAGRGHRLGRPGSEPGRPACPGDRRHPARPHGAACPPGGHRCRRHGRGDGRVAQQHGRRRPCSHGPRSELLDGPSAAAGPRSETKA